MDRILVTGSNGQVGSELVGVLREEHGADAVVTLDINPADTRNGAASGPHEIMDVRDGDALADVVHGYEISTIYHLASLLSAAGEKAPDRTWSVNMEGLKHVLDLARERPMKIFWPSSIAVFGPDTPRRPAPQDTILDPTTMYGITKVSGELLCQYYHARYGVDVRSLRYPGLISHTAPPGGGTTDYAVEMCYAAARDEAYTCFVRNDTQLPMMYMPDAIQAALDLMNADADAISIRTSYNIGALSFTAGELEAALARRVPGFECRYEPDERQEIADSWPAALDDSAARSDWGWSPRYDLEALVDDMMENLQEREERSIEEQEEG